MKTLAISLFALLISTNAFAEKYECSVAGNPEGQIVEIDLDKNVAAVYTNSCSFKLSLGSTSTAEGSGQKEQRYVFSNAFSGRMVFFNQTLLTATSKKKGAEQDLVCNEVSEHTRCLKN